jgi:kinesin family protein 5
VKEDKGKGIYV